MLPLPCNTGASITSALNTHIHLSLLCLPPLEDPHAEARQRRRRWGFFQSWRRPFWMEAEARISNDLAAPRCHGGFVVWAPQRRLGVKQPLGGRVRAAAAGSSEPARTILD
jgi:hypothetical protein